MREIASGQVHLFCVLGDRLALDVASGAVHRLDEVSWDVLQEFIAGDRGLPAARQRHGDGPVEDALAEVETLVQRGLLFLPIPDYPEPSPVTIVKSLCMNVAHDCNLRCSYCFAATGSYRGERSLMTSEIGRASVDFLIERSGSRQTCEMDFFGGEPLLNMPVVADVVSYAKKRGAETGKTFRFTLTTNATLLTDDIARFLNENHMQVILSLDGRPEVHDRFRRYPDGRGSHARVLERIMRFLEGRKHQNYYIRGTYTRENLDFTLDAQYFIEHGLNAFSLEPAVVDESLGFAIRAEDLPRVFEEYDRLLELYLRRWREGKPFTFYHFEVDLSGGPCLHKRMSGCGAGREYFAIAPDGSIYPCHQFDGDPAYRVGSVLEDVSLEKINEFFLAASLSKKPACQSCWARFYCGGGCHSSAWAKSRNLLTPDPIACAIQKKRLECAIYAQAVKAARDSGLAG